MIMIPGNAGYAHDAWLLEHTHKILIRKNDFPKQNHEENVRKRFKSI